MPTYLFDCPEGHSFEQIVKLEAPKFETPTCCRCPQHGVDAPRNYGTAGTRTFVRDVKENFRTDPVTGEKARTLTP
jgi:hypothetical protein